MGIVDNPKTLRVFSVGCVILLIDIFISVGFYKSTLTFLIPFLDLAVFNIILATSFFFIIFLCALVCIPLLLGFRNQLTEAQAENNSNLINNKKYVTNQIFKTVIETVILPQICLTVQPK